MVDAIDAEAQTLRFAGGPRSGRLWRWPYLGQRRRRRRRQRPRRRRRADLGGPSERVPSRADARWRDFTYDHLRSAGVRRSDGNGGAQHRRRLHPRRRRTLRQLGLLLPRVPRTPRLSLDGNFFADPAPEVHVAEPDTVPHAPHSRPSGCGGGSACDACPEPRRGGRARWRAAGHPDRHICALGAPDLRRIFTIARYGRAMRTRGGLR